jgi:hypothetical protein
MWTCCDDSDRDWCSDLLITKVSASHANDEPKHIVARNTSWGLGHRAESEVQLVCMANLVSSAG